MSQVVVVATFKVAPGRGEDALAALRSVTEATHAEAGCLTYALHRGADDPDTLVMVEKWTSRVALDSHMQQPYVADLGARAAELLAEPPAIVILEPEVAGDPMKGSL
jgi:quinol monooxygenase YgiN